MTSFKERGKKISKCAYNFLLPLANTLQVLKTREPRAEHLWQYAPPRHLWDYWALISSVLSKGWSFSFLFPALPALSSGLSRNLREDILRKSPRPWKVAEGLKVNPLWTWSLMCLGNVCWQPRDPRALGWSPAAGAGQERGFYPSAPLRWDPICRAASSSGIPNMRAT